MNCKIIVFLFPICHVIIRKNNITHLDDWYSIHQTRSHSSEQHHSSALRHQPSNIIYHSYQILLFSITGLPRDIVYVCVCSGENTSHIIYIYIYIYININTHTHTYKLSYKKETNLLSCCIT